MTTLRAIWAELLTPSRGDESAYLWMLIAIGHAVLGAGLALLMPGVIAVLGRAGPPVIYWLVKERADLKRGGSVRDGLIDAGFVALGGWYGAAWWPAAVIGVAVAGAMLRSSRSS